MPLVTVLMPVHNGAKYLKEAVESVLCQTMRDMEFLVVDDASVDESSDIIRSYADPRIRYIRSDKRLMLAGALNLGLVEARGEFVARMDADDICRADRLEQQVSHMSKHPDLGMCGSAVDSFGSGAFGLRVYPADSDAILARLLFDNPFAHPTVMFRRDMISTLAQKYDVAYYPSEDYELWTRVLEISRGANLPAPLVRYRVHSASMTRANNKAMDEKSCMIQSRLLGRLGINPSGRESLVHRFAGSERVYPEPSHEALCELENWLRHISTQNRRLGVYNRPALEQAIAEVWFSGCYRCLGADTVVSRQFIRSEISGSRGRKWGRTGILFFAWCRLKLFKTVR